MPPAANRLSARRSVPSGKLVESMEGRMVLLILNALLTFYLVRVRYSIARYKVAP